MPTAHPSAPCLSLLLCGIAALTILPGRPAGAQAPPSELRTLSPYFYIEDGDPAIDRLPLEWTEVRFAVSGVIADVTVKQTYKNDGTRPITARYIFPASTGAAVHGMRMTVGEQVIEAQIQERKQAQRTFEDATRAGKTASLLEQERPNVFSMRVANVMPGDRIDVELQYTEYLTPTEGIYEFVYPAVVGPRYAGAEDSAQTWVASSPYLPQSEAPSYGFALAGELSTGVPVQEVSVPSHQVSTRFLADNRVALTLDPDEHRGGDRDFILRYQLAGTQIESGLLLHQGDGENFFLLTVQPPQRVTDGIVPKREYVFVLDVSGSMFGFPLDTAKQLLRDLASGLSAGDTFNAILFSGTSEVLWPRSKTASAAHVAEAIAVIERLDGGGSTELLSALKMALTMPSQPGTARSFVVVTDGYIAAERNLFDWVRAHLGEANVFSFGIGTSVNRYLIEGLSRAGFGEAFIVTEPGEAAKSARRFREYLSAPVLTDIAMDTTGFDVYDVEPETIPDLLAQRPIVVYGKWRGPARGSIRVHGVTGAGPYAQVLDVAQAAAQPRNPALPRLWARTRIANISDFAFGQETPAEHSMVTALGLRYGLLTKFTSFVAVSHVVRNAQGTSEQVAQPLPLPLGVPNTALGSPMAGAPEPGLWLLAGLTVLGLGLVRYRARIRSVAR